VRTGGPPSERERPFGIPVLRAEQRLIETLAETVAPRVAERLRPLRREAEGFLDAEGAARHLCTSRKRIHELTSARLLRPDGRDGRRPLYRRSSLERYVEGRAAMGGRRGAPLGSVEHWRSGPWDRRSVRVASCPTTKNGAAPHNGPPPAHEVIAHEQF
jgi:hypothetical protein